MALHLRRTIQLFCAFLALAPAAIIHSATAQDADLSATWTIQGSSIPPEMTYAAIRGINDAGRMVGDYFYPQQQLTIPILIVEGEIKTLGTEGESGSANSISGDGVVVGTRMDPATSQFEAVIFRTGESESLFPGAAQAVNEAGAIAAVDATGTEAILWQDGTSQPLPGYPDGMGALPYGLNSDGLVVGQAYNAQQVGIGVVWVDGEMVDLGLPVDVPSFAVDVNDSGQVIGFIHRNYIPEPWVWVDGVMTPLPLGIFDYCTPQDINESGWIVGQCVGEDLTPVVWTTTTSDPVDLNTLLPAGSGWSLLDAMVVNNVGQIGGMGYENDVQMFYLLSPEA